MDLRHFSEIPQNAQRQENQRTRLTKRLLREGLLELLRDKPVEHITVKELCELAQALLEHIRAINQEGGVDTMPMLSYIRDNRELFRLLVYRDEYLNANQPVQRQIIEGYFSLVPELVLPCALPPEQVAGLIDALVGRAVRT